MSQSRSLLPSVGRMETEWAKDEQNRGSMTGQPPAFPDVSAAPHPLATKWRGGRGVR